MVIALGLLAFNWKMALAAVWPLPVAFAIVALAARVQEGFSRRSMAARIACEDGIQEYVETTVSYTHLDVYKRQEHGLWLLRRGPRH